MNHAIQTITLTLFSDNNVFGGYPNAPAGYYAPSVSDGYWAMLSPLKQGKHTLKFGDGAWQDVTYNINITPLPGTLLLLGSGLLGLAGWRRFRKS